MHTDSGLPKLPHSSEASHQLLEQEKQVRQQTEERVRQVAAEYKQLEIELLRYRDQFERTLASRTAELTAINEKLRLENRKLLRADRDRRQIKDQFHEASLLLETVLDAIPDIIGVQDGNHRLLRLNKAGYRFFDTDAERIVGRRCFELIRQKAPCDQCVTTQILNYNFPAALEKYIAFKDVWMDIRAYPILDMDGRVFRIVEHWRDISELKRNAASLIESEEKYRLLVENANEAIFIFQANQFRFSNRRAREMARKIGLFQSRKRLVDYIHADDLNRVQPQSVMRRLNGLEKFPNSIVFRLLDSQGEFVWVELNTVTLNWQGQTATLNFMRDVTLTKKMEHQLQEVQRMESIGTLAGGIAHDFNNLLMGIQGNVSLMYLDAAANASLVEKMGNIENCVESGSRLTKQLLGYARGGKYVVKSMDMNKVVGKSAEMFGRTRKAIRIHGTYDKPLWSVAGDSSQIEQVLLNLFLNAWQAMDQNGDLYLRTDNVELNEVFVRPYSIPVGRYVRVTVTDTGIGMDAQTHRRIFEPFFTTQKPGLGTGLGLASAFGIIKNHRGVITVESQLGRGSTFCIYLPASDMPLEAEAKVSESVTKGSETILLVDDEAYILEVTKIMLEGLGYTILTANSGKIAMELFARQSNAVDLVILDMVMPDLDGEAVFHQIRTMRPYVKVLFASGCYFSDQQQRLLENGGSEFIQKPFNLQQLSTKIRCILGG